MKPEFDKYATTYGHLVHDRFKDRFAGDAKYFHRRKQRLIYHFLAQHRLVPSRMSWLDVGCGQGDLLRLAAGDFARAAGCDPSSGMIKECTLNEVIHQPSPTQLPFADESFDLVTAICVYHHVNRDERAILTRSVQRVLKPGGIFCIIEHNPWNPITQAIVKRCPLDVDARLLSPGVTSRIVRSADLEVMDMAYFLCFPERVFARVGWIENALRKWPLGGQFACFCRKPERSLSRAA